jgi:hypothetical protein
MTAPSIWRRVRNTLRRPGRRHIATIDVSDDGVVRSYRGREQKMRWAEVTRIDAGVRDYITFDALYVVMFAGEATIEFDELDDGFRHFESTVFHHWPQVKEAWNRLLAAPIHEPQHETLWRR